MLAQQPQQQLGCKVFSATKGEDRNGLGEVITAWLARNPHLKIVDKVVSQSSDSAFHCLAITLFYVDSSTRKAP